MSLIPRDYLNAVVAIGVNSVVEGKTQKNWRATGFFVKFSEPNDPNNSTFYLITNKHVFYNIEDVIISVNAKYGDPVKDYPISLYDQSGNKLYTEHPNINVDIVAMQINPQRLIDDGAIWFAFDLYGNSLDLTMMMQTGVDEGSMVYSLGFPMNLVGEYKTPICRYGCISRISDAFLIPTDANCYLVDVHSFPGNSGGPIINKPENVALQGTASNLSANLIGVLSKNIQYEDYLISGQTNQISMVQRENSGLTIVHPVDRIREVVLLDWNRHRGAPYIGTTIDDGANKGTE